jgi:hypothetical protein
MDDHARNVEDILRRLGALEKKFGDSADITLTVCQTIESSVQAQDLFSMIFVKLLKNNENARDEIANLINKLDRAYTNLVFKRFGFMIYTAVVSITSAVAGAIIKAFISR